MGACLSADLSYSILKKSLVGSLIPDSHFSKFYRLCRLEGNTLSNTLRVNSLQSFYVVVSGEVVALVSDGANDPVIAAVFRPGDTICFFQAKISCSQGGIQCGSSRLIFQFRSTDTAAAVIGTDRGSIDRFVDENPTLDDFRQFFSLDLGAFANLQGFRGISPQQLNFLAPLMKLKRCRPGQLLKREGVEKDAQASLTSPSQKKLKGLLRPLLTEKSIGVLLAGVCAITPAQTDLALLSSSLSSSKKGFGGTGDDTDASVTANTQKILSRMRKSSRDTNMLSENDLGMGMGMGMGTSMLHVGNAEGYELILQDREIYPGSILGLEKIFIDRNNASLDTVVTVDTSIVGYFEWNAIKAIFTIDPQLKRALRKNFTTLTCQPLRSITQLLSELDDKMFTVLCSKVMLRAYAPGEMLCTKGAASMYSYVIIKGMVQETDRDSATSSTTSSLQVIPPISTRALSGVAANALGESRFLTTGCLIGEGSLVTDSPYFSTVVALEPTTVMCISKRTLDLVYNKDKAKLAELRIKLRGFDTDLQHILLHPQGNRLFYEYLKGELATESILFYNAVCKYEDMCERVYRACTAWGRDKWEEILGIKQSSIPSESIAVIKSEDDVDNVERGVALWDKVGLDEANRSGSGLFEEIGEEKEAVKTRVRSKVGIVARSTSQDYEEGLKGGILPYALDDGIDASAPHDVNKPEAKSGEEEPEKESSNTKNSPKNSTRSLPGGAEKKTDPAAPGNGLEGLEAKVGELKVVATSIIRKYIDQGGEGEVNIPHTLRKSTLDAYTNLLGKTQKELVLCIGRGFCSAHVEVEGDNYGDRDVDREEGAGTVSPRISEPSQPHRHMARHPSLTRMLERKKGQGQESGGAIENGFDFTTLYSLFTPAKHEVYKLMRNDNYPRFRKTAPFTTFITSLRPYDSNGNAIQSGTNRSTTNAHNSSYASSFYPSSPGGFPHHLASPPASTPSRSFSSAKIGGHNVDNSNSNSLHTSMCLYVNAQEHTTIHSPSSTSNRSPLKLGRENSGTNSVVNGGGGLGGLLRIGSAAGAIKKYAPSTSQIHPT